MTRVWTSSFHLNGRGVGLPARSPFAQGLMLLGIALALVVAVPLAILGLLVAAGYVGFRRLRAAVLRLRAPNGALDGRRNVRVRVPDSDGEA